MGIVGGLVARMMVKGGSSGCMSDMRMWLVPNPKKSMVLKRGEVAKVYVYDPSPISSVDPEGFVAEIAYVDGTIRSTVTGTVSDTADGGFVTVMLDGVPFGTVGIDRAKVRAMAMKGIALKVRMFCDGWIDFDGVRIRNVRAHVPEGWAE